MILKESDFDFTISQNFASPSLLLGSQLDRSAGNHEDALSEMMDRLRIEAQNPFDASALADARTANESKARGGGFDRMTGCLKITLDNALIAVLQSVQVVGRVGVAADITLPEKRRKAAFKL